MTHLKVKLNIANAHEEL